MVNSDLTLQLVSVDKDEDKYMYIFELMFVVMAVSTLRSIQCSAALFWR